MNKNDDSSGSRDDNHNKHNNSEKDYNESEIIRNNAFNPNRNP